MSAWISAVGRCVASTLLGLLSIAGASAQTSARVAEPPARIEITAQPIAAFHNRDPSRVRFGALEFRGGLVLTSPYKNFGGFSALRVAADGRLLAISDKGYWFRGRLVYNGKRVVGVADAEMATALGPDGRPLGFRRGGLYDTEAIAEDGGTIYVAVERANRILRFDYGKDGLLARGQLVPVPPEVSKLPHNKGLECLAFVPKGLPLAGALIAISERALDQNGNIRGFLIGGPARGAFTVKRMGDYDVSDCALTPAGDLLILERSYSLLSGVAMRIRRVALSSVKPGAVLDGAVLLEADMAYQVDNMEGLSAHRTPEGDIVLTLISDDNFSFLQRTILLQFTLVGG